MPFFMIISSGSQCGKTQFVLKLLKNHKRLFSKIPEKIFYFYNAFNQAFKDEELDFVNFICGLPENVDSIPPHSLVIFDDFLTGR